MEGDIAQMVLSAERRWMDAWVAGPSVANHPVRRGQAAPDMELVAEEGLRVKLSSYWAEKPALVMLWRHLGCGCGVERLERLQAEYEAYKGAGLEAVAVLPGDIERVMAYKEHYGLPAPVLADPDYTSHNAFGLSHWSVEQVLYDAPAEHCSHSAEVGESLQADRRESGLPLVDDPWMQSGEFVVDTEGHVRVAYLYNYCEDYPDPRLFMTAAHVASA